MQQPPRFCDPQYLYYVYLLKKSLYGLKQAPYTWYQKFADYICTIGFSHNILDHSLLFTLKVLI